MSLETVGFPLSTMAASCMAFFWIGLLYNLGFPGTLDRWKLQVQSHGWNLDG